MTAAQLLARIGKGARPAVLLLLGPEAYERRRIKDALAAAFSGEAMAQHDLSEISLAEVLDDARALSLFASERLIWVVNAESALPKGESKGDSTPLEAYGKDPTPGVTLVFEAARFDFEGEDKNRVERVRGFYTPSAEVVELRRFAGHEARAEAEALARKAGFRIEPAALEALVEALGADMARIAVEMDKLALYAGGRQIGVEDVTALVPDARASNVFALVNAIGRRDRTRALEILDTLTREGEYLPLALAFLATQFRLALVAREAGLKGAGQIQSHFSRMGVAMWGSRAEQVYQTVAKFSASQLQEALSRIYQADKGLRDARPDDRIVMERFILELVG